jgi:GDP/UDP-N,N'-diacetylbacillosamine 2-epimerase (hydrolysing)
MRKKKILVTTGTRADYGLLKPILKKIVDSKKLELYLVVTGMHLSKKYGFTINNIKKDGFHIHSQFKTNFSNDTLLASTCELGKNIIRFARIMDKIKPDINLLLGDRDEMFASATASFHLNIVNAHIHGGEKTGGLDEYIRHAITKISNIHFAATQKSKQRIIKLGENPKFVFLTGSPGIEDIIEKNFSNVKSIESKYNLKINGNEALLVFHPVTTQIEKTKESIQIIIEVLKKFQIPVIAIAPNSDAGNKIIHKELEAFSKNSPLVKLFLNMERSDYLGLLKNCKFLIGNSSSGIIEASYTNTPVLNIGLRQKNRELGKNIVSIDILSKENLSNAIQKIIDGKNNMKKFKNIYGTGTASKQIIQILENIQIDNELIQKQIQY